MTQYPPIIFAPLVNLTTCDEPGLIYATSLLSVIFPISQQGCPLSPLS
jgi:hypothetical protein